MDAVKIIKDANWRVDVGDITIGQYEELIAPLRDVAPVRHGKWINGICSECGAGAYEDYYRRDILTSYCPDCGARMDGKDNSNENRNDEG